MEGMIVHQLMKILGVRKELNKLGVVPCCATWVVWIPGWEIAGMTCFELRGLGS